MSEQKKLKVFSIGFGDGGWINNSQKSSYQEADIIVFPGGADISPELYGEKRGMYTGGWPEHDARHLEFVEKGLKDGKYMIGLCRGCQLLCVKSGGKLVQHVTGHGGDHRCTTYDNQVYMMNSIHHQMMYPWKLRRDSDYHLLSWTTGISSCYLDGEDKENTFPLEAYEEEDITNEILEPEMIWFPKTRSLCIQGHPEMLGYTRWHKDTLEYLNNIVKITFENKDVFKEEVKLIENK